MRELAFKLRMAAVQRPCHVRGIIPCIVCRAVLCAHGLEHDLYHRDTGVTEHTVVARTKAERALEYHRIRSFLFDTEPCVVHYPARVKPVKEGSPFPSDNEIERVLTRKIGAVVRTARNYLIPVRRRDALKRGEPNISHAGHARVGQLFFDCGIAIYRQLSVRLCGKAHNAPGVQMISVRMRYRDRADFAEKLRRAVLFGKIENVRSGVDQQRSVNERRRKAPEELALDAL